MHLLFYDFYLIQKVQLFDINKMSFFVNVKTPIGKIFN